MAAHGLVGRHAGEMMTFDQTSHKPASASPGGSLDIVRRGFGDNAAMSDAETPPTADRGTEIQAKVDASRELRRTLETQLPPLATSLDGRRFAFQAPLDMDLDVGGYVRLRRDDGEALGQIVDLRLARLEATEVAGDLPEHRARIGVSHAAGEGLVLGDGGPFHDADLAPADAAQLARFMEATKPPRARLRVGTVLFAAGVDVSLDAGGFNRHTFLCGQSGSGKSYALGVLLEQLLLETDLRIVVLDPNSDYAGFRDARPDASPAEAARWQDIAERVLIRSATAGSEDRLRLRFFELGTSLQAAVAGLDPLTDREEYGAFLDLVEREAGGMKLDELQTTLSSSSSSSGMPSFAQRIRNLGLMRWDLWSNAREDSGILGDLARDDWRCLVADLGATTPDERSLTAAAILEALWERRAERRPVLVVIDEAHNVCPQRPDHPVVAAATRHAVNIAAEGRKYGLHLLVATQRPQKVHENVLSQCDNLFLMRMSSPADLAYLADLFSFVPSGLTTRAGAFRQGEALVAGRVSPLPTFLQVRRRITREGGADVPATWAAPRLT